MSCKLLKIRGEMLHRVKLLGLALAFGLFTGCGNQAIEPVAPIRSPLVTPIVREVLTPVSSDAIANQMIETAEAAIARLRSSSPTFSDHERKAKGPIVTKKGLLKDHLLPGMRLFDETGRPLNMDRSVWSVQIVVEPWQRTIGPEGARITQSYNAFVYVLAADTGTILSVNSVLV
jgi:hypothetical protein